MNILTISRWEYPGGAEASAYNLFREYRESGHQSWLSVGTKRTDDPDIFDIPRWKSMANISANIRAWRDQHMAKNAIVYRMAGYASVLPILPHYLNRIRGREDFFYPGTYKILKQLPAKPDIIHCHNLHSDYFDIRSMAFLSRQSNLILNMRDNWLMTGHCAIYGQCERWRIGCGNCPDLKRYVSIAKDASAYNYRLKMSAITSSRYHLTAPSRWLLDQSSASPLGQRALSRRVVPNGIDVSMFIPSEKRIARERVGIDCDAEVVLFTAHNEYKDVQTMEKALARLPASPSGKPYVFLCFGRAGEMKKLGNGYVHYLGYIQDASTLCTYYSAADVYLHAAEGEAFGKTLTESMACGTPVVATSTGGIPEQVVDGEVGFLAPHSGDEQLALLVGRLLRDAELRARMGDAGIAHVRRYYSLERQAKAFLDWFEEILDANEN